MGDAEQKIPIIIWADLETAPLGQRSKLTADFAGRPLLRHTLERVCRSTRSGAKVVYCPIHQASEVKAILDGLAVDVVPIRFELPGWWDGLQAARKWAGDGWRGGLMSACAFDEDFVPQVLLELAKRYQASAVMTVSAHGAWVDPDILDRQIERYEEHKESVRLCFTQAPPGLAGVILDLEVIQQLPQSTRIAGTLLGYRPESPQLDLISKAPNLPIDPTVIHTGIRFTCDLSRSLALGRRLAKELDSQSAGAIQITETARREGDAVLSQLPREIEIELASGWPWTKGYRPSPKTARGPIDADLIIRRVAELTEECDDLLVHIGGFGEPTRHPQFAKIIQGLEHAGAWGISVQTTGLVEPAMAEQLAELPIDVLSFLIDVPQRELYQKVMGIDGLPTVLDNMDRTIRAIQARKRAIPLVVPVMVKTYETMELMKDFFDDWTRKVGWSVIDGFSDYAGQIPDLSVSSMAGPKRRPCRQIQGRLTILADGEAVICNQDFDKVQPAGSIATQSLRDIWQGSVLTQLRSSHREGEYACNSLCAKCNQWHRP